MTVKISGACRNCGTPIRSKYGYCQRSAECKRLYKREESRRLGQTEKRRTYLRNWYVANRERVLARQKEYHAANPERLREYGQRWRAANPDYERKRLARPKLRGFLLERQQGCC